ncbi:MAG TPA: hypothetical protein VI172_14785 [Candidatus Dormibacteraeota bacterium]|jgi:hypothetical protein
MALTARIRTDHYVDAMVALDNFELIEARVRRLLSHGRRISMTQRYTYTQRAPELHAGLTVDIEARNGGIVGGADSDGAWLTVYLRPGLMAGFGFSAYASDGNATEEEAWKRYHAKKAEADDPFERRRRMTEVSLTGGREDDEASRDDRIVVCAWNDDGVCDERVISFDSGR